MYPESDWISAIDEIKAEVAERPLLIPFFNYLKETPLIELQTNYVTLFDRVPSLSLHIFEHLHGESRDRGQAMVDLKSLYAEKGLNLGSNELPDFLPLFLEYLSLLPEHEALQTLAEPVNVLGAIFERLRKRNNPYRYIFEQLIQYSPQKPDDEMIKKTLKESEEANEKYSENENLDRRWVEQPAFKPIKVRKKEVGEPG